MQEHIHHIQTFSSHYQSLIKLINQLTNPLINPVSRYFPGDFLYQPLQYITRTNFGEMGSSVGNHLLNGLRPANRSRQLIDQVLLQHARIYIRVRIYILIHGAGRVVEMRLGDGLLQVILGWLHEG